MMTTFKDFLDEYNELINQKLTLKKELDKPNTDIVKKVITREISKLEIDIDKFENNKLYTQNYIDNLEAWGK